MTEKKMTVKQIAEQVTGGSVFNLPPDWSEMLGTAFLRVLVDAKDLHRHALNARGVIAGHRPMPSLQQRDFVSALEGMRRTIKELDR